MRWLSAASMILGLAAATAQGVVVTTVTYTGTWVVGTTSGDVTVDTYKVTQTAVNSNNPSDPNWVLQGIALHIGNMADDPKDPSYLVYLFPNHGDDPFQAWRYYGDNDYEKTVTNEAAIKKLTDPAIRAADTHFLVPNLDTYGGVAVAPDEVNDACYQNPQDPGMVIGTGVLFAEVCIPTTPVDLRAHTLDVATVGVVRGTTVWGWSYSVDCVLEGGKYEFLIPEPATLGILALGGLGLLRRRRSGFSQSGERDPLARACLRPLGQVPR